MRDAESLRDQIAQARENEKRRVEKVGGAEGGGRVERGDSDNTAVIKMRDDIEKTRCEQDKGRDKEQDKKKINENTRQLNPEREQIRRRDEGAAHLDHAIFLGTPHSSPSTQDRLPLDGSNLLDDSNLINRLLNIKSSEIESSEEEHHNVIPFIRLGLAIFKDLRDQNEERISQPMKIPGSDHSSHSGIETKTIGEFFRIEAAIQKQRVLIQQEFFKEKGLNDFLGAREKKKDVERTEWCVDHEQNASLIGNSPIFIPPVIGGSVLAILNKVSGPWVDFNKSHQGMFLSISTCFAFGGLMMSLLQLTSLPSREERIKELDHLSLYTEERHRIIEELKLRAEFKILEEKGKSQGNLNEYENKRREALRIHIQKNGNEVTTVYGKNSGRGQCTITSIESWDALNQDRVIVSPNLGGEISFRRPITLCDDLICCPTGGSAKCGNGACSCCCPVHSDTPLRVSFAFAEGFGATLEFIVRVILQVYCDAKLYPEHYSYDIETGQVDCQASAHTFALNMLLPAGLFSFAYGTWHGIIDPATKNRWARQSPHLRRLIKSIDFLTKWIFHTGLIDSLQHMYYSIRLSSEPSYTPPSAWISDIISGPLGMLLTLVMVPDYDTEQCCDCYKKSCTQCGQGCAMQPKQIMQTSFTISFSLILSYVIGKTIESVSKEEDTSNFQASIIGYTVIMVIGVLTTLFSIRSRRQEIVYEKEWVKVSNWIAGERERVKKQLEDKFRPHVENAIRVELSDLNKRETMKPNAEARASAVTVPRAISSALKTTVKDGVDINNKGYSRNNIKTNTKILASIKKKREGVENTLYSVKGESLEANKKKWKKLLRQELYFEVLKELEHKCRAELKDAAETRRTTEIKLKGEAVKLEGEREGESRQKPVAGQRPTSRGYEAFPPSPGVALTTRGSTLTPEGYAPLVDAFDARHADLRNSDSMDSNDSNHRITAFGSSPLSQSQRGLDPAPGLHRTSDPTALSAPLSGAGSGSPSAASPAPFTVAYQAARRSVPESRDKIYSDGMTDSLRSDPLMTEPLIADHAPAPIKNVTLPL